MVQNEENSTSSTEEYLHTVSKSEQERERLTTMLSVNNCDVRFQIDTGAHVSTICKRFVHREQVRPSSRSLTMWNKSTVNIAGETTLDVVNPKTNEVCTIQFLVVNNNFHCLLGLEAVKSMNLVTVNCDTFIASVRNESLGDFGSASLSVDVSTKPRVLLPCRKLPIAIRDKVKTELDNLVERGVITHINEPTDWVSQMAVVNKKNGSLRICIDPQSLNTALKREHYKRPTIDDILPELHNAKIFTKLDVKHGYWHVKLCDTSGKLTRVITPFGRYRWLRLPLD